MTDFLSRCNLADISVGVVYGVVAVVGAEVDGVIEGSKGKSSRSGGELLLKIFEGEMRLDKGNISSAVPTHSKSK